jgi:hypothetical protein
MTTSLQGLARCLNLTGSVSVKNALVPRVENGRIGRPGLGPHRGAISLLRVMRYLEWQWCGGANYLKMPVPAELRSPSREEAQILIDGIAQRITLFMGKSDWELDWHIFPRLDDSVKARLQQVGQLRGDTLFCEFMVVNRWEDELIGRQWWSNDVDGILLLRWPVENPRSGAETASDHWSLVEDDHQGGSAEVVADINDQQARRNSRVVGGRVYLQGAFVNDAPTDPDDHNHLEIHPLDSVAYARDGAGSVLSARPTDQAWPDSTVDWRVAVVTNAGFHRINSCGFVAKERTTVWYLDLPGISALPTIGISVTDDEPGFWHTPSHQRFQRRGVKDITVDPPPDGNPRSIAAFPVDPQDGRRKLRVQVTMNHPDDWGGLFLRDYRIHARSVVTSQATPETLTS